LNGNWDQAEAACEKILSDIQPDHVPTLIHLSRIKLEQKQPNEARIVLEAAVVLPTHQFETRKQLGQVLFQLQRFSEATDRFLEAFQLNPVDENLPDMLAISAARAGRRDEAEAALRAALEARPNLPMVRISLAGIAISDGDVGAGIELLETGRELAPDHLGLVNNLALLRATITDPAYLRPTEACLMIEEVCRRTQYKKPQFLHTLSLVYFTLRRVDEALEVARRAKSLAEASEDAQEKALVPAIESSLTMYQEAKDAGVEPLQGAPTTTAPTTRPAPGTESTSP
jgi:tetratricopeptide (TPR) repeat protein